MKQIHVQANYIPAENGFRLVVGDHEEKITLSGVPELQFARIVEYLDTVWASYCEAKQQGKL
jgi:hypothetical protein